MVNRATFPIFFFLFSVLLLRICIYLYAPKQYSEGDRVRITAQVTTEPVKYDTKQYFKIAGLKVYLPRYPEIGYGDDVVVEGVVEGDNLNKPVLVELRTGGNWVSIIRERLIEVYDKSLPQPYSALIGGMVLGSKSGISSDFWSNLKKSGTAHVVVASGMNVTLVATFLVSIFTLFLRRKSALVFVIGGIWIYALLSGFDTPIIRATIMGTIVFTAQEFGRLSEAKRSLFITAVVMALINPDWIFDVGFQLSFFATLSLILFGGPINKFVTKRAGNANQLFGGILNDFSTSIAAQIGVLPILHYYFGEANVLSPFVNSILLWTVAPITVLGMLGGVLGLLYQPLGMLFLYLAYPFTYFFVSVVRMF